MAPILKLLKTIACFGLLFIALQLIGPGLLQQQLSYPRVRTAKSEKEAILQKAFKNVGLNYPATEAYLRVFKSEKIMELWARNSNTDTFSLVKKYPICAMSGSLGPKRKQGDKQVPEGFYRTAHFNPNSKYYLSLKLSYPNRSDRILSPNGNLGGDIYLHGDCASWGCVSITDSMIKEVYWLAVQTVNHTGNNIPVHIFPSRLSSFKLEILKHLYKDDSTKLKLWENLSQAYTFFDKHHKLPPIKVGDDGYYSIN